MTTILEALNSGTAYLKEIGVESARLEMELILCEAAGLDRVGIYVNFERPLAPGELERARAMLKRRREREPLAYVLGWRDFYGVRLKVRRGVLIPRPETELIVDRVLAWVGAQTAEASESERVEPPLLVDIGTGSGAIAVAAAHELKERGLPARWVATDVREAALEVARENAEACGVAEAIEFRAGAFYEPLSEPVDVICVNPPYVAEAERAELAPEVAKWEPAEALFSGAEGLGHLERLIAGGEPWLKPGGLLLMEFGAGQEDAVRGLVEAAEGLRLVKFHADLAGRPRMAEIERS